MKAPALHTGCSGFYNRQWKGIFYPESLPSKEWFGYYCQHFTTFEVNATFYKFPTLRIMQNWYNRAPEQLIYAVKAPKVITHIKRFTDCAEEIAQFYSVCREGLAEKLGPVLFQLPPSFSYTPERLEQVTSSLNPEYKNVVEFRNISWWIPQVYEALAQARITFCSVNYPKLPTDVIATAPLGYVRLHGSPKLFYSEYSTEELEQLQNDIFSKKKLKDVYVFFNNTASSAGIINAVQFKEIGNR